MTLLKFQDLVTVGFHEDHRVAILRHVSAAMTGGHSDIYGLGCGPVRQEELRENQIVGLACHGAFALLVGKFDEFLLRREEQDRHAYRGDGGWDHALPNGIKVDVKGSEAISGDLETKALHLCLTQARNKVLADVAYVLAVTRRVAAPGCGEHFVPHPENEVPEKVIFTGWLYGRELYKREDNEEMKGWSVFGRLLRPMKELLGDAR
jgi:hypothetical protein